MNQKENKEEQQLEKERIIKFAASLGINLTVVDRPSNKNAVRPEKLAEANRVLSQMNLDDLKK